VAGILLALRSGVPWETAMSEIGCSGYVLASAAWLVSCRCGGAGIAYLLKRLAGAEKFDQARAALGFSFIAVSRHTAIGPNPLDRGSPGTKRHVVVNWARTPLYVSLGEANRHECVSSHLPSMWSRPYATCGDVTGTDLNRKRFLLLYATGEPRQCGRN
jgi:hypothetical protein